MAGDSVHMPFRRAEDLGQLRSAVAEHASAIGLAEEDMTGLLVAVTELAANTIQHSERGYGCLRVWIDDHAVVCEINDAGPFRPGLLDRPMPTDLHGRGFGLPLTQLLVERLECTATNIGTAWKLRTKTGSAGERTDGVADSMEMTSSQ